MSPLVAVSTVRGRRDGRRASTAARKRAPKSLKASDGPWNSSKAKRRQALSGATGVTGTSGTGKSNASRTISASSCREYSGASSRHRISVQRSGQGSSSSSAASAHGASSAGT